MNICFDFIVRIINGDCNGFEINVDFLILISLLINSNVLHMMPNDYIYDFIFAFFLFFVAKSHVVFEIAFKLI